jgi:hypothetical protein
VPTFSNKWFQGSVSYWERLFDQLGWRDGGQLTAIEIGSFEGQSLWTLANLLGHTGSRIHCVDIIKVALGLGDLHVLIYQRH